MTTVAAFFPGWARARPDFQRQLLTYARSLLGVPYEINLPGYPRQPGRGLGKKYPDLDGGLDCAGYVLKVLQHMGLLTDLNPDLTDCDRLWAYSQPIDRASAKPADLVFFRGTYATPGMSHIGFVTEAGGGTIISARAPAVREEPLAGYWEQNLAGFGRPRGFPDATQPLPRDDEPLQTKYLAAPRDLSGQSASSSRPSNGSTPPRLPIVSRDGIG
jgi:NlpC/P60 family